MWLEDTSAPVPEVSPVSTVMLTWMNVPVTLASMVASAKTVRMDTCATVLLVTADKTAR